MHVTEYTKRALFELVHSRICKVKLQEVHRKEGSLFKCCSVLRVLLFIARVFERVLPKAVFESPELYILKASMFALRTTEQ
jgi:hypothetical protein